MEQPGAKKEEREELKTWLTSAFKKHATLRAGSNLSAMPGETPQQHQARIQAYGEAFGRVILGDLPMDDTPKLLNDLQHLMMSDCPVLDLVELMLLCTEDFSMGIADLLLRVGIKKNDVAALQRTLNRTAHAVEVLNQPALSTPLDYIEERFPDIHEQQRVRELIETLPDALRYMSVLLNSYPPKPDQLTAADQDHFVLGWLYLLVAHYGLGAPAASHLLKAMRCAREAGSHPKSPRRRRSFGEKAIERRLSRYWERVGSKQKLDMKVQIIMYTEFSSYKKLRRRGETLLSLLVRLEEEWNANAPRIGAILAAEQKEEDK